MLFRFCLYGFLKNQQYCDPFLILAFREKGLSFTAIGLLFGFRELAINLLEIPTGAVADVLGRRRIMVGSFLSYIGAFLIFGRASDLWMLFAAMVLFSMGEALRTGTHKAIIFDWLEQEGRSGEKTRIYGLTRSWSKLGSALGVVIAAILVFTMKTYSAVFFFTAIPYAANAINLATYPRRLDGPRDASPSLAAVWHRLCSALTASIRNRSLRRLLGESMSFEGCHRVCKDYLQPLLKSAALSLPILLMLSDRQRTAVLVGVVYAALYLASSAASRHAGMVAERFKSEEVAGKRLWQLYAGAFLLLSIGIVWQFRIMSIAAFASILILQNLWRPLLISRVASQSNKNEMATLLSIESQAKSLFAAIAAPLLGLAVDVVAGIFPDRPDWKLLPVGLLGLVIASFMARRKILRSST